MTDSAEPHRPDVGTTTRIRLDVAYDGTNFTGWSRQPAKRTVQGELEKALAIILGSDTPVNSLVVAGRTDAGVHATGQVAHLDLTPKQLASLDRPGRGGLGGRPYDGPASLGRRLNGIAGADNDLHVARTAIAYPGFDARFAALSRTYEYRIADLDAPRNPLERHRTVWFPGRLDPAVMNAASFALLGLHDWGSFCKPREGATTVRALEEFYWVAEADGTLTATVAADAFCHTMVRSLVGACVAAGQGYLTLDRLRHIRDNPARGSDFKVMPAHGLTMVGVTYPPDEQLQARADLTRARRSPLRSH